MTENLTNQKKAEKYRKVIEYWYNNNIVPDVLIWLDKSNAYDILEDIDRYHPEFKKHELFWNICGATSRGLRCLLSSGGSRIMNTEKLQALCDELKKPEHYDFSIEFREKTGYWAIPDEARYAGDKGDFLGTTYERAEKTLRFILS